MTNYRCRRVRRGKHGIIRLVGKVYGPAWDGPSNDYLWSLMLKESYGDRGYFLCLRKFPEELNDNFVRLQSLEQYRVVDFNGDEGRAIVAVASW